MDSTQYCTFRLGHLLFGVEVTAVQEVLRPQDLTPVPLARGHVRGLIKLRGHLVTAIDVRRRLGLAEAADARAMNVVVGTPDGPVSLLVDEIGGVVGVDATSAESSPDTLDAAVRQLVPCLYRLDGALLLVLDTKRLLDLGPEGSDS